MGSQKAFHSEGGSIEISRIKEISRFFYALHSEEYNVIENETTYA